MKRHRGKLLKSGLSWIAGALWIPGSILFAEEKLTPQQERAAQMEKATQSLKDEKPPVEAAGIETLRQSGGREHAREIARLLKDGDAGSTVDVMNALKPLGADGAAALLELLEDENPKVRASAAWALQGLADGLGAGETQDVAETLVTKLEDEDDAVRRNIIYAFTPLAPHLEGETAKRVADGLLARLEDGSWDVRQAAPTALEAVALRLEEATLDMCLQALFAKFTSQHEAYDQARYAAALAYGSILFHLEQGKAKPLVRNLLTQLEDEKVHVRQASVMALEPVITRLRLEEEMANAAVVALLERLKDVAFEAYVTDQYVIRPLGELVTQVNDPTATFILEVLFARLLDDQESDRIRQGAGYALRPGIPHMTHEQREKLIQLIIADPNGVDVSAPTAQLLELVAPYLDGQRAREVATALFAQFNDLNLAMRSSTIVVLGTMAEHLEPEQLDTAIARGEQILIEDRHHFYTMAPVERALEQLKNRKQAFGSQNGGVPNSTASTGVDWHVGMKKWIL